MPIAAANSLSVSNAPGAESIRLFTAVLTNSVVAICVVLVPNAADGARGVPVKVGLLIRAYVLLAPVVVRYEALLIK